jgi:hypothetical protein
MRVLITGVGGPTPRSIAASLRLSARYQHLHLYGADSNRLALGLYKKDWFVKSFVVPRADHPEYWTQMRALIDEHKIDYAIIQPEMEVLAWSEKQHEGALPCPALLPHRNLARALISKTTLTDILSSAPLVPKSVSFERSNPDLVSTLASLPFPFWVRSSVGTSGLGSLKIESIQALQNWILINPDVKYFIASEYLPGRNLACKLLYFEGKLIRAACAERVNYIMAKVAPSGITGNTSFGRLINEDHLVTVAQQAMDILFNHTGAPLHGFFTVDFKENAAGVPLITEVNVRHVAFTRCFAMAGANFSEDSLRLLEGDSSFDRNFKIYHFDPGTVFLRDVDETPLLINESQLFR